jgi:hypothetical protein
MNFTINISISPEALAELASLLEDRCGTELEPKSVRKALETYMQFEVESIASDPITYAQSLFTNGAATSELKSIVTDHSEMLAQMLDEEAASYQRMLDQADYYHCCRSY